MTNYYIMLALLIVVLVNNLFGSMTSVIEGKFDWTMAKKGLLKGLLVSLGGIGLYCAGLLTPEITIGLFNEMELTLTQTINAIVTGGFVYYAYQDIVKLKDLVGVKISSAEIDTSDTDEIASAQRGN